MSPNNKLYFFIISEDENDPMVLHAVSVPDEYATFSNLSVDDLLNVKIPELVASIEQA